MADESESARSRLGWLKPRSSSQLITPENVKPLAKPSLNNKPSNGCFQTPQRRSRSRAPCYTKPPGSKSRDATTTKKPPWQRCMLLKWRNAFAAMQFQSTADMDIRVNIPLNGFIATQG